MKQALIKRCSFILFALMSVVTYAQTAGSQIKITGTVTDNTGLLLPGVNVTEKSSKNSVTTDYSGRYQISVKPGATLVFSFIGMKKIEIPLNGRTNLDAKMQEDSNVLNEIVVVGYGSQKKDKITGAIATIKPEDVQDLPVTNLSESLRGLVPGLQVSGGSRRPGETASLQIRQTFSFSKDGGSNDPLIVIDDMVQVDPENGLPTMETFNRLDPTEIESITVLKDASAAIYGSRASQGAVIVKTKRGKAGVTKFSYQNQFAVNDAVSHAKVMNAYEFGVFSNRFQSVKSNDPARLFSETELNEMKGLDYNWLDKAWRPAIQQKHALNVSGGNEKTTYFAGLTFLDQGANLGDQTFNKWTYRVGINTKITNSLELSATVAANNGSVEKSFMKAVNFNDGSFGSSAGGEQADYSVLLHMPQYIPWETTINGKDYFLSPFPKTTNNLGSANTGSNIAGWNYFATLGDVSKSVTKEFSYNVNLSLTYKVPFIKGLSVKGSYARVEYSDKNENVQLPYDLLQISNYWTQDNHLLGPNSTFANNGNPVTNISRTRVQYDGNISNSIQSNFFLNYDRTFRNHEIGAMFSVERSENEWQRTRMLYENTGKDYNGGSKTAGTLNAGNSYALKGENGTMSYLGRLNYSYKSKYLMTFLFRSDASTKFAPENYWGFFPSLQLGWIASKEEWFTNALPGINYFKVRYSVGKTGKDNIGPWKWQKLNDVITDKGWVFGTPGTANNLGTGISPLVEPNPEVGWDSTIKHNLGFDVNVLSNRLQIGLDTYFERTKDGLISTAGIEGVPFSVGGGFAEEKYAGYDAWGTELSLNWSDKIKDDFSYNVGVNFGISDNELTKYPEEALTHPSANQRRVGTSLSYFPQWGFKVWKNTSTGDGILRTDEDVQNYWNYLTANAAAVGGVPNYMGVNSVAGMYKGMLAYQDLGGQFNPEDGTQAGPDGKIDRDNGWDYAKLANSSRTYGFTTNLGIKYKGFYARTQISTSWGGIRYIDRVNQGTSSAHNMWSHEVFWNDMYGSDNLDGKYPNLALHEYVGRPSDFWMVDTFRCTVRNLTVGYALPQDVLKKAGIASLTIGVTGNNLWDLYNPYPNHYRNMYDDSTSSYPTLRTWALNFNIAF